MNKDLDSVLKEVFPPTPPAFTKGIEEAVRALPPRRARWRLPAAPVIAYVAVTCGLALLILNAGPMLGALGVPIPSASPRPNPSATAGATRTPYPTAPGWPTPPPAEPLPQLQTGEMEILPASADGWQVAAVEAGVKWYFNPSKGELACVNDGAATVIPLALGFGQEVKPYTFLPAKDGRWVAFTVHEDKGDKVWLVTADGRKLVAPDDVTWLETDYATPVAFDMAGLSLVPYYHYVMNPDAVELTGEGYATKKGAKEAPYDSLMLVGTSEDGKVYGAMVSLNTTFGYPGLALNDRRGHVGFSRVLGEGETLVVGGFFGSMLVCSPAEGGGYRFPQTHINRSYGFERNRFALFHSVEGRDFYQSNPMKSALFVYDGDPTLTLWELNGKTGEIRKITANCVAAGWTDENTYWYARGDNGTEIVSRSASGAHPVEVSACISFEPYDSNASFDIHLYITNHTALDVAVPADIPCSLTLRRDDAVIQDISGFFSTKDANTIDLLVKESENSYRGSEVSTFPVTIPPEGLLDITLSQTEFPGPGTYTLEGHFYDGSPIALRYEFPEIHLINPDVGVMARVGENGDMRVTFSNNAIGSYSITYGVEWNAAVRPKLKYRLFSGNTLVKEGLAPMTQDPVHAQELTVPVGDSRTMGEALDGEAYSLAGLAPGKYRLEGVMIADESYANLPWGFAFGDYFTADLTVD